MYSKTTDVPKIRMIVWYLLHWSHRSIQLASDYKKTQKRNIHLAADRLLVLLAGFVSALVGFDAEASPASGARGLTCWAGGFFLVLE